MTEAPVERCALAPDLEISRVLTGLWQIADMERDGTELDLDAAAEALTPYVEAGLTTFDMADHYGSAETIAGSLPEELRRSGGVQLCTKWVPEPGARSVEEIASWILRETGLSRSASP